MAEKYIPLSGVGELAKRIAEEVGKGGSGIELVKAIADDGSELLPDPNSYYEYLVARLEDLEGSFKAPEDGDDCVPTFRATGAMIEAACAALSLEIPPIWTGTRAQYDAIANIDGSFLYFITE